MKALAIVCVLGGVAHAGDDAWHSFSAVAISGVSATSTFADKRHPDSYAAKHVLDEPIADPDGLRAPQLAWCEGKPDAGIGEGITIALGGPQQVDAIRIAAGVWLTPALFAANNRPTQLAISIDGGAPVLASASDAKRAWVEVPIRARATTISIKIAAVGPTTRAPARTASASTAAPASRSTSTSPSPTTSSSRSPTATKPPPPGSCTGPAPPGASPTPASPPAWACRRRVKRGSISA
ncbi:MAG TPA: hypothetical protein VGM88_22910 [Kofleriaceae bacterium]|jgi:hypothetical protein